MTVPTNQMQVLAFYGEIEKQIQLNGAFGFMKALYAVVNSGNFFIRKDADYYRVALDKNNPFTTYYVDVPLP